MFIHHSKSCLGLALGLSLSTLLLASACEGEDFSDAELAEDTEDTGDTGAEAGLEPIPGADDALTFQGGGQSSEPSTESAPMVACPGARVIGVLNNPSDSCELDLMPLDWTWQPMFTSGSPGVSALTEAVPDELQRFCIFAWEPQTPATLGDYPALFIAIDAAPQMQLHSVAPDCMGEVAQADLDDVSVSDPLRDSFHHNVDWVHGSSLGTTVAHRTGVDVAIIDTVSHHSQLDPFTYPPTNDHGLQMEGIISDLACPNSDPACTGDLHQVLAMPRDDWASSPNWANGGSHGTQGDVALAIYQAIQEWRQRRVADPLGSSPRLVVNLSLGWDRRIDDTMDPNRGPNQALRAVLEMAACEGVLVLGAAGNNPEPECAADFTGVVGPANYEDHPSMDLATCSALGYPTTTSAPYAPMPLFPHPYNPLIHAVGGVDEHDAPLINARDGGEPRLVALGANASAYSSALAMPKALTGTSVSTAVASGIAALIWSYRPDLTAHEVVEFIYTSGYDTGRLSSVGLYGPFEPVRRMSACASLADACASEPAYACPHLGCFADPPATEGDMSLFFDGVQDILAGPNLIDAFNTGETTQAITCGATLRDTLADPQPEEPVCPHCNINSPTGGGTKDDSVHITFERIMRSSIADVSLTTYDSGRSPTIFVFSAAQFTSMTDPITDVTTVYIDAPDTQAATLTVTFHDGSTQANALPVSHR